MCLISSLRNGTLYLQSTGALCSDWQHNLVIYPTVSEPTNTVHVTAINRHNMWIIKPLYSWWGVVFGTRPSRLVQSSSCRLVLFKTNMLIFWIEPLQFRTFSNRFVIRYEMLFNTCLHCKTEQVGWKRKGCVLYSDSVQLKRLKFLVIFSVSFKKRAGILPYIIPPTLPSIYFSIQSRPTTYILRDVQLVQVQSHCKDW